MMSVYKVVLDFTIFSRIYQYLKEEGFILIINFFNTLFEHKSNK